MIEDISILNVIGWALFFIIIYYTIKFFVYSIRFGRRK